MYKLCTQNQRDQTNNSAVHTVYIKGAHAQARYTVVGSVSVCVCASGWCACVCVCACVCSACISQAAEN